jgi:hypothetical protein
MPTIFRRLVDAIPDNNLLYHFTKLDTALRYVIPCNRLQFSKLSSMDDPFETEYLVGAVSLDEHFRMHSSNQTELNDLRSKTPIKCFCQDRLYDTSMQSPFPFCKGWAKSRMWSQYGDYHTGACLVFDRQELLAAIKQDRNINNDDPLAGPVKYDDKEFYTLIDTLGEELKKATDMPRFIRDNQYKLLFLKNSDYRDEDEFRFALPGYLNDLGMECLVDYKLALKACLLGYKYDSHYDPIIKYLSSQREIPFFRLEWFQGTPNISAGPGNSTGVKV